ncbi:DUF871 domain-containing protein [Sporosarcina koreensis]|uniref:DUF871 domain-containing protein n=1 Tax=Sporosarcina koreensis TaxID=334735 RepID=UPI00058B2567|nr:MupG family TIM beta-alpha barrel fold protein [Sporosarcina koreensis]
MIGCSVYLGTEPFHIHEERLRAMQAAGFRSIFTSLHVPENDASAYKEEVRQLGALARGLGMELMVDVSPTALGNLGLSFEQADQLTEWGISGLRLDYGIAPETIAALSQTMRVAVNASTVTHDEIAAMKAAGLNLEAAEAWHNFYPRPETALGKEEFTQRNDWLHEEGLTVMAFAPGDGALRGPLFETLPTLEKHRRSSPFAACLELLRDTGTDKVLIGDPSLSGASLAQYAAYGEGIIPLRADKAAEADGEALNRAETVHTNRPDSARDVIRSTESRHAAMASGLNVPVRNCTDRSTGSITVDNERYMRYQGELQVTKRDLQQDERVNVLGRVVEEDLPLLKYIGGSQKFRIIWQ